RAPRTSVGSAPTETPVPGTGDRSAVVVTGEYGARVLTPLLDASPFDVQVLPVRNDFFGGNIAVTGLLAGPDIAAALDGVPDGVRVLLPDVCLSEGRFIDGSTVSDLGRPVEVVGSDGLSLRTALELSA
ncbi:MAG TPA: DUF512 domain-containing protein, partial [Acidimicrobiales bacterium]|nr:DUF512 domain-containing protein [Acidimicrobiales bacterium]